MKKNIIISILLLSFISTRAQNNFPDGVFASKGTSFSGSAVFSGSVYASHFHYSASEDTYIRGGKPTSTIYIGDVGGNISLGNGGQIVNANGLLSTQSGFLANKNSNFSGSAVFAGSVYASHFQYSDAEDTYIRGGKGTSNVIIADVGNNVVIGNAPATATGYKLFVERGILTEKVKVAVKTTGDWSDHVFRKDYPLMPLSQLHSFIQTNNHLPGVPSAKEMVNEGIDLGKMDAKLLEKIEELTLYILDLKKENEAVKQRLAALEKEARK